MHKVTSDATPRPVRENRTVTYDEQERLDQPFLAWRLAAGPHAGGNAFDCEPHEMPQFLFAAGAFGRRGVL